VMIFFQDRVSGTVSPGWLQPRSPGLCLLSSKITGVSHQCQAKPRVLELWLTLDGRISITLEFVRNASSLPHARPTD
jgi:hypothetical protein